MSLFNKPRSFATELKAFLAALIISNLPIRALAEDPKPAPQEPQLPGAVLKRPEWMRTAPFDLDEYFAMPPAEQNAASLYLEALYEFSKSYPYPLIAGRGEGDEDQKRLRSDRQRLLDRAYFTRLVKDPDAEPVDIDRLIDDYRESLRSMEKAQTRPRCVFPLGLMLNADHTLGFAAKQASGLWALEAERDVDRGDIDGAIKNIEKILRLSRDLRPRGAFLSQSISHSMAASVAHTTLPYVLADPRVQVRHCERILALLDRHEAEAIDPFVTSVKAEYIKLRVNVRTMTEGTLIDVDANGLPLEKEVDRQKLSRTYFGSVIGQRILMEGDSEKLAGIPLDNQGIQRFQKYLEEIALDPAEALRDADDVTRALLDMAQDSPILRHAKIVALEKKYYVDGLPREHVFLDLVRPPYLFLSDSSGRNIVNIGVARCRVALKRWQIERGVEAPDLEAACRAAGLPEVPRDGFADGPLRLIHDDEGQIIYSIGSDGRDDHGLKDSNFGNKPEGDLLYRVPKVKPSGGR